jgi:homoserine/homoserine lactone efflux protein
MSWQIWALFALTEAVLSLTPGPAVLLVLSQALTRGPAKSVWSSCGILAANGMYFAISATGLGAVIVASHDLFFAVKWIGAAYLVYLGLSAFFGKGGASAAVAANGKARPASAWRLLSNGFVLQAANPKALIFFTALLPQFIDPAGSIPLQILILGATSILVEFVILAVYGMIAGQAQRFATRPRFVRWTDRVAGSLLIGAGVGLAAIRRS